MRCAGQAALGHTQPAQGRARQRPARRAPGGVAVRQAANQQLALGSVRARCSAPCRRSLAALDVAARSVLRKDRRLDLFQLGLQVFDHLEITVDHLVEQRVEVGEILMRSGVPTLVFQAGVVIGSGSASFEMVRHLTEVLPYMPAPKWVRNHIQPIAIRDVLYYLVSSARLDHPVNRAFDIGGPDILRYGQMMNGYAVEAGLRQRAIAALPVSDAALEEVPLFAERFVLVLDTHREQTEPAAEPQTKAVEPKTTPEKAQSGN